MSLISAANRHATFVQRGAIVLIAVSALSILQLLPMAEIIESLRDRIDALGAWGPVAFGALYIAATVLVLPGAILTLAAGALFGPLLGTATVSVASVTGAALAFLIARYFARTRVEKMLADFPKFEAIDRAIGQGGWKIVGMLRLSPAIPFNISNYLYGLTSIRFWPCVLTSWVAMAPGTFMYVYLGYLAAAGVESAVAENSAVELGKWALRIAGLVATVGVTVYITRIARRAIADQTDIDSDDASESGRPKPAASEALVEAHWPWRATWIAVAAALALSTAAYARSNRSAFESRAVALLAAEGATRAAESEDAAASTSAPPSARRISQ